MSHTAWTFFFLWCAFGVLGTAFEVLSAIRNVHHPIRKNLDGSEGFLYFAFATSLAILAGPVQLGAVVTSYTRTRWPSP